MKLNTLLNFCYTNISSKYLKLFMNTKNIRGYYAFSHADIEVELDKLIISKKLLIRDDDTDAHNSILMSETKLRLFIKKCLDCRKKNKLFEFYQVLH